jgi:hypothetical protein
MAGNTYLTIDMITAEAVMLFKNSNLFIMNMDTQYDDQFAVDGAKIGDTLRIRLPSDFIVTDGPAMQLQDNTQQFTSLTVSSQKNVATPYTTAERTMSIDKYSELVMAPMVNALCGKVASTIMKGAEGGVCNLVSNVDGAGNIISPTMDQFTGANAVLDDQGATMLDRRCVQDPTSDARTVSSLAGLLNPSQEISAQFRSGMMKSGLGYDRFFRDQTVIKHTTGTFSAGGTVNGGGQTTSTSGGNITVNAITGTLKKGDIVTFAGVNAVNRVTKDSLGTLRQFVVTADVATTVLPLFPSILVLFRPLRVLLVVLISSIRLLTLRRSMALLWCSLPLPLASIVSLLPTLRRPLRWRLLTWLCPRKPLRKPRARLTMASPCVC